MRAGCGYRNGQRRPSACFDDPTVDTGRGAEARTAVRLALRGEQEGGLAPGSVGQRDEPIVLASGNLGLVSFPAVPHRMTMKEIEERHPALIPTLTAHPGIGFVLVRSDDRGALAIGRHGVHELDSGKVDGVDPLAIFGPGAAETVRRTDSFPHCADLMINSSYGADTGEVHSFEEQIGSHGGLGGGQNWPFLLYPAHLPVPEQPLTGAESLHHLFIVWLDLLQSAATLTPGDAQPVHTPGAG